MVQFADVGGEFTGRTAGPGRLFLWFPVGLAMRKVSRYLRRTDCVFATAPSGALTVDAPHGYPEDLLVELGDLLTSDEAGDTRCVFKEGPGDLSVDDIRRVRTVHELRKMRASSWLLDMLRAGRFMSYFQPIVHADETTRVLGHEALLRGIGRDGQAVSPAPLFDAARGCGMLWELDTAAQRSAIRAAAAQHDAGQIFLNLTPDSLRDGLPGLEPAIAAIEAAEIPRERVVFEVIDAERAAGVCPLRSVVAAARNAGFRVALDDLGCDEPSRRLVHDVRPDYVKLDMGRVRSSALPHLGDAERLMDLADHLRVGTIAEGVETVEELAWNRERGATYVQGYYIAPPESRE